MLLCNGSPTTAPNTFIHSEFSISPRIEEFIDIMCFQKDDTALTMETSLKIPKG